MFKREQEERKKLKKIVSEQNLRRTSEISSAPVTEADPAALFKKKHSYLL